MQVRCEGQVAAVTGPWGCSFGASSSSRGGGAAAVVAEVPTGQAAACCSRASARNDGSRASGHVPSYYGESRAVSAQPLLAHGLFLAHGPYF